MRPDMKRVIINRPRYPADPKADNRNMRRVPIRNEETAVMKYETKTFARKQERFMSERFNDHLTPLKSYLRAQIGRPWDKIWSEVCQQNDTRRIDAQHLRRHLKDFVDIPDRNGEIEKRKYGSFREFRVDIYGILRKGRRDSMRFTKSERRKFNELNKGNRNILPRRYYETKIGHIYAIHLDSHSYDGTHRIRVDKPNNWYYTNDKKRMIEYDPNTRCWYSGSIHAYPEGLTNTNKYSLVAYQYKREYQMSKQEVARLGLKPQWMRTPNGW